ncbi:hypothetical protein MKS88_004646 [Plasmodium brasilianum]|uniref:Uncharacterized protein n=1 Tax=Plasmodium brasilianum TaxID=5824 RepID=A0ACB9Y6P3_PLABR|nr:hypothetical protein MKS88_004646 [Plasmodium brasilianum]
MFNVFSKAFLDSNSNNFNSINKPINNSINKSNSNIPRPISSNINNENDRSKNLPLKDRLATVRNVQNILNKKNFNKEDDNNNGNNNNNINNNNNEDQNANRIINTNISTTNDVNKPALTTESNLSKFKNYSSVVNEKQNEELEKKLKKRKRRRKHVIIMERMKQKEKEKKRQREMKRHQNNEEEEEEEEDEEEDEEEEEEGDENEDHNNNKAERRYRKSGYSQNKYEHKLHEEEEEDNIEGGEDNEERQIYNQKNKSGEIGLTKKLYSSGTNITNRITWTNNVNATNDVNNANNTSNNANGNGKEINEPGVKPKRKRRKKKEMEEYRARLLKEKMQQQNSLSSIYTKTNSFNDNNNNNNNNENNTQGEVKVKRRRGRPKLSEVMATNNANEKPKQNDIRKYYSRNSENPSMSKGGSSIDEKDKGGRYEEENKNVFKIIKTSIQENTSFMKKSPTEIIELEKSYKNNIKKGVTCIPLNYQSKGGGMAIILIGTETTYGPVKNSYGFMTFLVLDCHPNNFYIDTGIKNNVIECEKHMQLLISPGDMYMFKNQSQEVEARLLLIVCNKMNQPFDAKMHIKDPEINTHK